MKSSIKFSIFIFVSGIFLVSCQKKCLCPNCNTNQPPIANAGVDQKIILPKDSIFLDGSNSSDPDGKIISYKWVKISGPGSSNIINNDSTKTLVKTLVMGVYNFRLQVTDNMGAADDDTVQIELVDALKGQEIIYNGGWGCNDLCRDGDVYWDSSPWNSNLYSDPNTPLQVSIRLDTSSVWTDVRNINSPLPPINQFYWQIDRGYLWVFAYEGRLIGTTVIIKAKFL